MLSMRRGSTMGRISSYLCVVLTVQPFLMLAGCGGGGGGPSTQTPLQPPDVTTVVASGSVNRSEIGGQDTRIATVYQEAAELDAQGAFSTIVSGEGAQVVFAQSPSGEMRGLAIAIPSPSKRAVEAITLDAESTALCVVFMTPGIIATDPAEAAARIQEIRSLSGFPGLVSLMRSVLPTADLSSLGDNEAINDLLEGCITEWMAQHESQGAVAATRAISDEASVEIRVPGIALLPKITSRSNLAAIGLELDHFAWRYVAVHRKDIRNGSQQKIAHLADTSSNLLGGGVPLSWGSLFTGTALQPAKKADTLNMMPPSGATTCEYWVEGPGFAQSSDSLPSGVESNAVDAWGLSFLQYTLMPLIDGICGVSSRQTVSDSVRLCWDICKSEVNLSQFMASTDSKSAQRHGFSLAVVLLSAALRTGALVRAGIVSSSVAASMSSILKLGVVFAVANLTVVAWQWSRLPPVSKITIHISFPLAVFANGPYEVWASNDSPPHYEVDYYNVHTLPGYVKIGAANGNAEFPSGYRFYVVATPSIIKLDAIRLPNYSYYPQESHELGRYCTWGNVHLPWKFDDQDNLIGDVMDYYHDDNIYGKEDGLTDDVGHPEGHGTTGGYYQGFVLVEDPGWIPPQTSE